MGMLLLHIIIALGSIVWTSYVVLAPSVAKIKGSYVLVALTLLTGTVLVMTTGQHILQACITGLLYTAAVSAGIAIAQRRLVRQAD